MLVDKLLDERCSGGVMLTEGALMWIHLEMSCAHRGSWLVDEQETY
jgi:hypothetical protein